MLSIVDLELLFYFYLDKKTEKYFLNSEFHSYLSILAGSILDAFQEG